MGAKLIPIIEPHDPARAGYDIGFLDPNLPPVTTRQVFKHYFASAQIYAAALLLYAICPWFNRLLQINCHGYRAMDIYFGCFALYLVVAPVALLVLRPKSLWISKNILIVGYFGRLLKGCFGRANSLPNDFWRPNYAEKNALAFLGIKLFYGPLMLNSALIEYNRFPRFMELMRHNSSLLSLCDKGYLLFVSVVFFIDSVLFTIGYHLESGFLKNQLRYAETNALRILVCIVCYAPFNSATSLFLGPSNQDIYLLYHGSPSHPVTWIFRGAAVLSLLLLTAASLSLFTKASNLTNRGIVTYGPYRFIRHPGYLGKNLFWLTTCLPIIFADFSSPSFSWGLYLERVILLGWAFLGWGTIYFLRALAEEAFLMRDPDYVAYCKKVKYRFIPGVY